MKNKKGVFLGYIIFFITIAGIITVSMLIYGLVDKKYDGNLPIIAGVMFLVIVFASLFCTVVDVFRRKIMVERPVDKILDATARIASGDFTVRLEIEHSYERYDGYDFIMENLNKMATELEKSAMLGSDFISNVSHEIKTPLAIIQNYATALTNKKLDDETRIKYCKTLSSTAKRLTDLVINILKLNKLENQPLKEDFKRVKLDDMLAESVIAFEDKIEEKGLQISCDLEQIEIVTCPDYLQIVWNNLISNAIKFTQNGGSVSISLKQEDNFAIVKVSDTGCGISKEVGERIFDKFYQGDTSHAQEGNGLGLALVKKVIDVLGGKICVDSQVGKGTVFTVSLNNERK